MAGERRRLALLGLLLGFSMAASWIHVAADGDCGAANGNRLCPGGLCCSQYGWCGSTKDYCATGCQSNCWITPTPYSSLKRVGYYPNWAAYTPPPYAYFPENISVQYFTHLIYSFAGIDSKTFQVIPTDSYIDLGPDPNTHPEKGLYLRFNRFIHSRGAKTLLSIGGGGIPAVTKSFSDLSKTSVNRLKFINSAISFARKYGFDGLDIDWEIPSNPVDKANFGKLLTDFRTKIEAEKVKSKKTALLLTAAVAAWGPDVQISYNVPILAKTLDWVGVMTYDFHGSWEEETGLHTALVDTENPAVSITGAIGIWKKLGLSPKKIVLGLAAYGHSWTLTNPNNHGVGAPATGVGKPGPISKDKEGGTWSYFEITNFFVKKGAKVVFDSKSSSVYAYSGSQWIGYDDVATIKTKAKFAKDKGLGGYMFWSINQDDKNALVGSAQAAVKG